MLNFHFDQRQNERFEFWHINTMCAVCAKLCPEKKVFFLFFILSSSSSFVQRFIDEVQFSLCNSIIFFFVFFFIVVCDSIRIHLNWIYDGMTHKFFRVFTNKQWTIHTKNYYIIIYYTLIQISEWKEVNTINLTFHWNCWSISTSNRYRV